MSLLTGMLQLLPPETAHNVTIQLTKYGSPLISRGFQGLEKQKLPEFTSTKIESIEKKIEFWRAKLKKIEKV